MPFATSFSLRQPPFDKQLHDGRVPVRRPRELAVRYKGTVVGEGRAVLIVAGRWVVELKALPALAPVHTAQVISYLKATGLTLGLLVNFGERQLRTGLRRVAFTA
jgi:GxxExxY protein